MTEDTFLNDFDLPQEEYPEYTEEDLRKETEAFKTVCGSCDYFIQYMGEAGFCELAECNCLCENPNVMIDMWDKKCSRWIANPESL